MLEALEIKNNKTQPYFDGFLCRLDAFVFIETWLRDGEEPPNFESYKCESLVKKKQEERRACHLS